MEAEGIYYYFENIDERHKMIVANTPHSHAYCPSKEKILYFLDVTRQTEDYVTSIGIWQTELAVRAENKAANWLR